MNITMMLEKLEKDGIPNYMYTIDDIDPVDKYYIGKVEKNWEVYYGERGEKMIGIYLKMKMMHVNI